MGYDVDFQVDKAYNICPQRLGFFFFFEDLDALTRSRHSLNLNLCFLGTHGVINAVGTIWSSQHLYHYVARVPEPVFFVLTTTVVLIYESCVSRAIASTSEGRGYYYGCLWLLDWHQMLWLIFVHQIGSQDLICVRHVWRGYRVGGVYLYPPNSSCCSLFRTKVFVF